MLTFPTLHSSSSLDLLSVPSPPSSTNPLFLCLLLLQTPLSLPPLLHQPSLFRPSSTNPLSSPFPAFYQLSSLPPSLPPLHEPLLYPSLHKPSTCSTCSPRDVLSTWPPRPPAPLVLALVPVAGLMTVVAVLTAGRSTVLSRGGMHTRGPCPGVWLY